MRDVNTETVVVSERYKKLVMVAGFASVATALLLIVMKLVVWILSGSSSILASLTDSLVDCIASLINLLALKFALSPADKDHRFGHFKAEALAALAQAAFISGSAILVIFHGVSKLTSVEKLPNIDIAIYVSVAAIVITIALVVLQAFVYKITKSEAVFADRLHYLSDVVFNLGVILALVLSKFGFYWADGVFASILGLFILRSAFHIAKNAISVLLDKSLSSQDHEKIMKAVLSVPEVVSIHDLMTRVAGPQCFIQCHIVLPSDMMLIDAHNIADRVEKAILNDFPEAQITLHMEPDDDKTFKEVRFLDHITCEVPRSHYINKDK